ncbi:MAG: 5-formyltetrahydrofolate cyclo-ligase, partial [Candidatus Competibacteraceae bacterium]|nr:5-formyltetrahydrofolate cyclo-ligase [Candidatus Competibacteraceae bacterium]
MIELKELRRSVRQRRRQLDPAQRDTAQRAMLEHLTALNVYQTAHRIAGYW